MRSPHALTSGRPRVTASQRAQRERELGGVLHRERLPQRRVRPEDPAANMDDGDGDEHAEEQSLDRREGLELRQAEPRHRQYPPSNPFMTPATKLQQHYPSYASYPSLTAPSAASARPSPSPSRRLLRRICPFPHRRTPLIEQTAENTRLPREEVYDEDKLLLSDALDA